MAKPTLAKDRATDVVSLKVTLRGVRPPIWRRLHMPSTMTLGDLHQAIQAAMGWRDCHLHAFDIDGQPYGDRRTTDDVDDESRLTLNGLLKSDIARFGYTYDFGDTWDHAVAIEKIQPAANETASPACVAGRRNCPPEDCGGSWGYQHLMAVLADPEHPEHAEQLEWIGEGFNPDALVVETANAMLAAQFKRIPPAANRPPLD